MDKETITKLEKLVEEISECYSSIPIEIINELNALTKNEWTEKEYIEYCAEYWSRSTLEETVYALLHGGEYPNNVEERLFFWKTKEKVDLSDKEIMFQLRALPDITDEEIIRNFDDLPVKDFYHQMNLLFSDWRKDKEINEDEIQSGSFKVTFHNDHIEEYAKFRYVILRAYGNKLIDLNCCNLYENEKKEILSFANNYGLYLYEK